MCNLWNEKTPRIETATFIKFLDGLYALPGEPAELHIIGGEPFIDKDVFSIIEKAASYNARVVTTTSGYSVDEECASNIAASGLSLVNISIDSLRPEVHNWVRGRDDAFERAMAAISFLSKHVGPLELAINTVLMSKTLSDACDLVKWVEGHDQLSQIYFMAVMRPFGSALSFDWQETESGDMLWPRDTDEVNRVLDALIAAKERGAPIGNSVAQFEAYRRYFLSPDKAVMHDGCKVGTDALNLNAKGDAYLCFFKDPLGNIANKSAKDLWYSQEAELVRAEMVSCKTNCELVINCYFEES